MGIYSTETMDVLVRYDDVIKAHEAALDSDYGQDVLQVPAEVNIDEAIELASEDQLRDALRRDDPGYTTEQIEAIRDCFSALCAGDTHTAAALLPRIFEHLAQRNAAELGMTLCQRIAA